MTDKKRKSLPSGSELPKKKTKISVDDYSNLKEVKAKPDPLPETKDAAQIKATSTPSEPSAAGSKKSRKRAADFLSDNEDEAPEVSSSKEPQTNGSTKAGKAAHQREKRKKKKAKKAKRDAAGGAETLTADGVNGITEKKDSAKAKTTTARKPAAKSMQAEAQSTVDQELEDEWGGFVADADATKEATAEDENREEEDGAHLLAGFDSDSSDREDKDYDGNIPGVTKKGRKMLSAVKDKKLDKESGVVYLGRIPHGFYEAEMRGYLGQYGDITRLRLSRNKRTGASKHFAFVEFESSEVARIVAEANNNYMMFGHRLKCSVVKDPSKLHEDVWKGANKKFRRIPHEKIEREKLAAPKSVEAWEKKNQREQKKRDKKAKELKGTIGYDMPEVKLKDPKEAVAEAKLLEQKSDETVKAIENGEGEGLEEPAKAIGAAKEAVAEPPPKSNDVASAVNADAKGDVAKTVTKANEPEAATNGNAKAVDDSSSLSKEDKKALRKAKKVKAKAEAAGAKGASTGADNEEATAPKQKSPPPAGTKLSADGGASSKSKAKDATNLRQENQVQEALPVPKDSDGQKERKKDKKDKKKAKLPEQTDQPVAEVPIKVDPADKKAKKKKNSKPAA